MKPKSFLQDLIPALGLLMLTSCGTDALSDYMDEQISNSEASDIEMSTHVLEVWEGDTLSLGYGITYANGQISEDKSTNLLYWYTREDMLGNDSTQYLSMTGSFVKALQCGETWVYVQCFPMSAQPTEKITPTSIVDSCQVKIINWEDPSRYYRYPYDMVVYASLELEGQYADDDLEVGAFIDGKACGYGEVEQFEGRRFLFLRVWSDRVEGQQVTFRCYSHSLVRAIQLDQTLPFDADSHGTLSDLFVLTGKF